MARKRMSDKAIRKEVMLLRKECANFDNGTCLIYEEPCFVYNDRWSVHDGAMNCDYFNNAVLPLNKDLETSVWNEIDRDDESKRKINAPIVLKYPEKDGKEQEQRDVKRCIACKLLFYPSSDRQARCDTCREQERKETRRTRRKERDKQ